MYWGITSLPSLVVFYRESLEEVAGLWNASAEGLGLTVLRPLAAGELGWDICGQKKSKLMVGLEKHFCELSKLELYGRDVEESWLETILKMRTQPVEVFLCNFSYDFATECVICDSNPCEPEDMLDCIESGWTLWGIRTRQALHNDILSPLKEWQAAARERGYPMRSYGSYQILDIHSNDGVPYPEKSDPVTGLPADDHEVVERQMQHPFGTRILLAITAVEPNPERNYETWLEVLPRVAQTLTDDLSEGDTLARYYTPREFVITKPGLPYSQARAELERLRALLETSLKPMRLKGRLSSASWPEEVPSAEEMTGGSGWDKLMDRAQSLLL